MVSLNYVQVVEAYCSPLELHMEMKKEKSMDIRAVGNWWWPWYCGVVESKGLGLEAPEVAVVYVDGVVVRRR